MHDLTFISRDNDLLSALSAQFHALPVAMLLGDIRNSAHRFDCIVSPGNSFGLMDGGIDAVYAEIWPELPAALQAAIMRQYNGEQPVGSCLILPIPGTDKWLAHCPTMRVPMNIVDTDHVYVAMRALLLALSHHADAAMLAALQMGRLALPGIRRVLCPGLGTGAGGMPADKAARHMRYAWDSVRSPPAVIDWTYADNVHARLGIPRP